MSAGSLTTFLEGLKANGYNTANYCERALVGSLLIDCGLRGYAKELSGAEFSDRALGRVFDMIMDVEGPIDLVLAAAEAEKRGLDRITGPTGFIVWLASLVDFVPDVENVAEYAKAVKRFAVAREVEAMRIERANRMGL